MKSPAYPDPWLGRSVGDRQRYRLVQRLGAGGMGDVFVAMDTLLGQHVALKLLKDKLVGSSALRKRFEREVAICAALKSDHIVNVSDYGVTPEGYPFYVMEYLRGQTLKQLLQKQSRVDVKRAARIIAQVCEGLRLAHAGVTLWWNGATTSEHVKVVHRDLKPDNIFLVPTALGELVKILDFGIAKIRDASAEQTTFTRGFIGTFRYAAPEQLRAEKNLDERADIYSLGVILYEMLSGTDPYYSGMKESKGAVSWAMIHRSHPVALRARTGCAHLSPALEAVVMRCLQKEPSDRFASVEQLNQALQAAISEKEVIDSSGTARGSIERQGFEQIRVDRASPPSAEIFKPAIVQTLPALEHEDEKGDLGRVAIAKATETSSETAPSQTQRLPTHVLFLLGTGIGFSLTLLATVSIYQQLQPKGLFSDRIQPPTKSGNCKVVAPLDGNTQKQLYQCQLEYAKQLAASNKYERAIATANKIPKSSPLYPQAQALIQEWSEIY